MTDITCWPSMNRQVLHIILLTYAFLRRASMTPTGRPVFFYPSSSTRWCRPNIWKKASSLLIQSLFPKPVWCSQRGQCVVGNILCNYENTVAALQWWFVLVFCVCCNLCSVFDVICAHSLVQSVKIDIGESPLLKGVIHWHQCLRARRSWLPETSKKRSSRHERLACRRIEKVGFSSNSCGYQCM